MIRSISFSSYSPVGDLNVIALCFLMIDLVFFSYINKTRGFRIFLSLIGLLLAAAYTDVTFYFMVKSGKHLLLADILRCAYHALLFLVFTHFVIYIINATKLERPRSTLYEAAAITVMLTVVAVDVWTTVHSGGITVTETGMTFQGRDIFYYGYFAFVTIIVLLLVRVRSRLYKRVMRGFYGAMAISFTVLLIQGLFGQTSFTVSTFMYPVVAMFYIMHSNPYDAVLGSIDSGALSNYVHYHYEKHKDFMFMSLYMRQFHEEGKPLPTEIQAAVRRFTSDFFKGAVLFQVGNGHEILLFSTDRNPDYEQRIDRMLTAFYKEYNIHKFDYKIVIGTSVPEISLKNEYVSFLKFIHRSMQVNTVHRVTGEDVERFSKLEQIEKELESIHAARDLDDPRVLAYCQPVLNILTQKYDTAEALMRLQLPEVGMVYPDQFIPLAEANGSIHTLTEIILHKTCRMIRRLEEKGCRFERVSVNVSVPELKSEGFLRDITGIIQECGVTGDKVALELTESRSDSDFLLMKSKISDLRAQGIKIYLDDFGTGYSNMERIMELPFDIIKFDRSLVIASGENPRSEKLVESLAAMFANLDYSVLYEDVENESDEKMCREMGASYLQGYKYSRPIPIEKLEAYFEKENIA